jgi:anti-anti-sigma factor
MRNLVPFVSEQKVSRAENAKEQAKRAAGKLIDDVVATDVGESSWDDLVPKTQPARTLAGQPKQTKVHPPMNLGTHIASPGRHPKVTDQIFSDGPSVQWVPINSGKALRIDVMGAMDKSLRSQWRRLLAEVEAGSMKEFEINLLDSPSLSLTGLGMLLMFRETSGASKMALCNCNKSVQETLFWSGMDKYFLIQAPVGK